MNKGSRFVPTRRALISWTLFIGLGAVAGAVAMLADTSGGIMGMDAMLPYFQKLPFADVLFRDFLFSGIALLIVNGLTNLTAAVLLILNKKSGVVLGGVFGVTLMLWICIQFYMFPPNFMSTLYFFFGLIQALTGYAAYVFMNQETFAFNASDYRNVGSDPQRLVVYFSRMGYVKKLAYETADAVGAQIVELKATEPVDGTLGFWWCGRFGMHRWDMPIKPVDGIDKYEHVTVCAPIWVFSLAAPVRRFCREASGKVKKVDYVLVHHNNSAYESAAREMDELLGIKHTAFRSVRCRLGRYKTVKESKTENSGIKSLG